MQLFAGITNLLTSIVFNLSLYKYGQRVDASLATKENCRRVRFKALVLYGYQTT